MNRRAAVLLAAACFCGVLQYSLVAQTENRKIAQTGMKFLALGAGPRQAALGDAFSAVIGNSSAMFYNTAGMAFTDKFADVSFSNTKWIADIVHNHLSVALAPFDGDLGVFGVSFQFVDYGEVQATILSDNPSGYVDVGTIKPSAYAMGVGYALALSDRFSVGGNIKFVGQNLGTVIREGTPVLNVDSVEVGFAATSSREVALNNIPTFDFGVLYQTGLKSLTFGVSVRNFAKEVSYVKENFQLPLTFRIGISMNLMDLMDIEPSSQSLLVVAEAEHPRDYPEQLRLGAEYVFANTLALRVGYVSPADEYDLTYGLGLMTSLMGTSFGLDYSNTPFTHFDTVHRFSVSFAL